MWASWSTRSSRWTSSPSSHRQAAASVKWVRATTPVADRAFGEPLVEPGERVLGGGERAGEFCPRQRIGDLGAGLQSLDNLKGNRSNGSYHGVGFRHSEVRSERSITIDNCRLSIGLDVNPQISNSQRLGRPKTARRAQIDERPLPRASPLPSSGRNSPLPAAAPVGPWRPSRAPQGVRRPRYRSAENRRP